ncbi:MAG: hypothetical protein RIR45_1247 [Pseudomonadota bacterium]
MAQILPGPNVVNLSQIQGELRDICAVAAGLIAATGLKLVGALMKNTMGELVCYGLAAITFVAIALLRVPLFWVLLSIGVLACAWAYRQITRAQTMKTAP